MVLIFEIVILTDYTFLTNIIYLFLEKWEIEDGVEWRKTQVLQGTQQRKREKRKKSRVCDYYRGHVFKQVLLWFILINFDTDYGHPMKEKIK